MYVPIKCVYLVTPVPFEKKTFVFFKLLQCTCYSNIWNGFSSSSLHLLISDLRIQNFMKCSQILEWKIVSGCVFFFLSFLLIEVQFGISPPSKKVTDLVFIRRCRVSQQRALCIHRSTIMTKPFCLLLATAIWGIWLWGISDLQIYELYHGLRHFLSLARLTSLIAQYIFFCFCTGSVTVLYNGI